MPATAKHGTRSRYTTGCRCAFCRAANNEYEKARRPRHPRKTLTVAELKRNKRDQTLRRSYGITLAEFHALVQMQHGRCACCGIDDPCTPLGWSIDHDHSTGDLRGIVCNECNRLIAALGDNLLAASKRFAEIVNYLQQGAPAIALMLAELRHAD